MSSKTRCVVCGKILTGLYCTINVCEYCCSTGNCPAENLCYAKQLERNKGEKYEM